MKKWMYELLYRFPFVPIEWIFGSTLKIEKLAELGIEGSVVSGRAITLGCGVGRETIYLAKKGFDVIGLDFSPTAIKQARRRAKAEGVEVPFIVDDLTNLRHIGGTFDLVTDFGALNDMGQEARDLYMQNVLPLTHPGSRYLMFCFDKMLPSDEVKQRFSEGFMIETLDKGPSSRFPGALVLYLMTRKEENP
jgi:SAM-dependent methyltransferase